MLPTMRAETPSRPRVISVYSPFCGFSASATSGERRLTPSIIQSPPDSAMASSV